ncbi:hypothetical protein PsorP6_014770 [Peronosclerospora sorghi]|uniref:Uncharacterized protein n=1 Tax=Peronosclerospora sorghi TaxID=230839 RepID=A0ACC0VT41_9STRA|nr:hypothetical protein PsorP6_014770 [Peronosclerospora sorghi]
MAQKFKKSSVSKARKTRIDKDVKTTLMHSRVLAFLYDLMWSYRYFPQFACGLLLVEAFVGCIIIQKVAYTEIDWSTYMQQVELFKGGERDYMNIRGDTGPLVYPAGFLYVFSLLHSVTDDGQNIRRAHFSRLLSRHDCLGCVLFSLAVSIKMNVLLFAPALFFLLLQSCGIVRTAWYLFLCAAIQIALGYPFLNHNWWNYLSKAF